MTPHDVVFRPVMSEKAIMGIADNKYAFYVHPKANRSQVKRRYRASLSASTWSR